MLQPIKGSSISASCSTTSVHYTDRSFLSLSPVGRPTFSLSGIPFGAEKFGSSPNRQGIDEYSPRPTWDTSPTRKHTGVWPFTHGSRTPFVTATFSSISSRPQNVLSFVVPCSVPPSSIPRGKRRQGDTCLTFFPLLCFVA